MIRKQKILAVQTRNKAPRPGVTLMEVVVSTLLVSMLIVVSLSASANMLRNQAIAKERALAWRWLPRFADEVSGQGFVDSEFPGSFGLESGEVSGDRTTFDDQDDYHDLDQTPPTRIDGTTINALAGWRLQADVYACESTADSFVYTTDPTSSLRVVILSLTSPSAEIYEHVFMTGSTENSDTNLRTTVGELKILGSTRTDETTIQLLNRPVTST